MDHYATRYPTNVIDIANFLVRLSGPYFTCILVASGSFDINLLQRFLHTILIVSPEQNTEDQFHPFYIILRRSLSQNMKSALYLPGSSACRTVISYRMRNRPAAQGRRRVHGTASCIPEKLKTFASMRKETGARLAYRCLRNGGQMI